MALRTLCDVMIQMGKSITTTFIDYTADFDTVSHKFIDEDLCHARVCNKVRTIFREIYKAASAYTTVPKADGGTHKFTAFPIRRGVVQVRGCYLPTIKYCTSFLH